MRLDEMNFLRLDAKRNFSSLIRWKPPFKNLIFQSRLDEIIL